MRTFQFPEMVREALARRYRTQHRKWLTGNGQEWQLTLSLGCPGELEAQRQPDAVRAWVSAWQSWQGAGELIWCERRWRSLGTQRLPERLVLHGPETVAAWLGEEARWQRASTRYRYLLERWPCLANCLPRYFDSLADYSEENIQRLEALLSWIEMNPNSNLYPRQMPIAGMDSKWLDGRKTMIADLVTALRGEFNSALDFFELCGLKQAPYTIRFRILDDSLRRHLSGLGDVSAPVGELAVLDLPVARVYIVENLQTGLAFGDLPDSIVFMGLGYGVDVLARLPWLTAAECVYWGDLDTHGFHILNRARSVLPRLSSVLMDEKTLLAHRHLWVEESEQDTAVDFPLLTADERSVYQGLKQQRWGRNVRLEQERIAWNEAWEVLRR
jgi:hypothetical protein